MSGILQLVNTFPSGGFAVKNSLRFRQSVSAYLNRTSVTSPTNNKIFTISMWVKRGLIGDSNFETLFGGYSSQGDTIGFGSGTNNGGDSIQLRDSAVGNYNILTTPVYRDPSAWYHLVISIDTTQSTASNRVLLYVNGTQVTSFSSSTYPSQNYVFEWNSGSTNSVIGRRSSSSGIWYFDGYMAEINFIDGQALTPSSFGAFDATSGVWQATRYSGTYGTNGFYLKFSNTTSTTTLCYDYSGNNNNWTPNNISLTAGSTYDSMLDSPTNYDNGGNGVGNYAVLNPVNNSGTLSNANLTFTQASAAYVSVAGSIGVSSGKWAWEIYISSSGSVCLIGICSNAGSRPIDYTATNGWVYQHNGQTYLAGSGPNAYGASYTTGDTLRFELDADAGSLVVFKNNVSQGVMVSGLAARSYSPLVILNGNGGTRSVDANFGQRPFTNSPSSGYKALNTQNLPAPSIQNGANYMAATTYTGNGTSQSISNANNGVSFQPDLVWGKSRTNAYSNVLVDVIRGATNYIVSNATAAEATNAQVISAFTSNGFSIGNDLTLNASGASHVAWQWKAGGTAVTNTAGSITSSVSANTTSGFAVVTYTGNGVAGATVGHGLGVAPAFIIIKDRTAARTGDQWPTYHVSIGATGGLVYLNSSGAGIAASTVWNNTNPSSSLFTLGNWGGINYSGDAFVAYCFAAIPGYSAFGSYTGNGSSDGPFVYCGFRPRYVMVKKTSSSGGDWPIMDTSRGTYNAVAPELYADLSQQETNSSFFDILSNGFKARATGQQVNANGDTYIYAAFAENPFKYSLAR